MAVNVLHLATGDEYIYTCTPEQAVVACYEQVAKKNFNTADYLAFDDHPQAGRNKVGTIYCGDFTAFTEEYLAKHPELARKLSA